MKNIFIRTGRQTIERIDFDRVMFIGGMQDYINIHTNEHRYTIHCTMYRLLSKLDSGIFLRVHKSFIVNIDKIKEINIKTKGVELTMECGNKVPVSRKLLKGLMDRLNYIK